MQIYQPLLQIKTERSPQPSLGGAACNQIVERHEKADVKQAARELKDKK